MCVILYTENKYLKQIIFLAIEEDEVPYYTGRKKLADEKDATVDYEENKKTLIKRYVFRNNSVVYLSNQIEFSSFLGKVFLLTEFQAKSFLTQN